MTTITTTMTRTSGRRKNGKKKNKRDEGGTRRAGALETMGVADPPQRRPVPPAHGRRRVRGHVFFSLCSQRPPKEGETRPVLRPAAPASPRGRSRFAATQPPNHDGIESIVGKRGQHRADFVARSYRIRPLPAVCWRPGRCTAVCANIPCGSTKIGSNRRSRAQRAVCADGREGVYASRQPGLEPLPSATNWLVMALHPHVIGANVPKRCRTAFTTTSRSGRGCGDGRRRACPPTSSSVAKGHGTSRGTPGKHLEPRCAKPVVLRPTVDCAAAAKLANLMDRSRRKTEMPSPQALGTFRHGGDSCVWGPQVESANESREGSRAARARWCPGSTAGNQACSTARPLATVVARWDAQPHEPPGVVRTRTKKVQP